MSRRKQASPVRNRGLPHVQYSMPLGMKGVFTPGESAPGVSDDWRIPLAAGLRVKAVHPDTGDISSGVLRWGELRRVQTGPQRFACKMGIRNERGEYYVVWDQQPGPPVGVGHWIPGRELLPMDDSKRAAVARLLCDCFFNPDTATQSSRADGDGNTTDCTTGEDSSCSRANT